MIAAVADLGCAPRSAFQVNDFNQHESATEWRGNENENDGKSNTISVQKRQYEETIKILMLMTIKLKEKTKNQLERAAQIIQCKVLVCACVFASNRRLLNACK